MTYQETTSTNGCCSAIQSEGCTTTGIMPTTSKLSFYNYWDHFLARWGYRRNHHRIAAGLYALGEPTQDSPVFVTANYSLSFDALRSALDGMDGYILVLDTLGVNVWCAAGKGTFGTDELVNRIQLTRLDEVISHKKLMLPQLGAPGINGLEVRRQTGFRVEFGPVRAQDIPDYIREGGATPEMRKARFNLWDRIVLVPIELVHTFVPMILAVIAIYFLSGLIPAIAVLAAFLAGAALFPLLLPILPTRDFSSKGLILGGVVTLPSGLFILMTHTDTLIWWRILAVCAMSLALPPVTAYLALNFTGATPFTSKSGVKREMKTYIPIFAWMFGSGAILWLLNIILIRVITI